MDTVSEGESSRNINSQSGGSKKHRFRKKTPFQLEMLEKTYAVETHPSEATTVNLSKTLGLLVPQLQSWFSARRLKNNNKTTVKKAASDGGVVDRTESSNTIKKLDVLKFKVGQLAETKSFEEGFRSAWFRCKIKDISLKKNQILAEYYDFEVADITWANIYEEPPYGRKSKHVNKQLMVRPQYPQMYHKTEMPAVDSISKVCVVIDGMWKVGDLVDWYEDDCYWSATIIQILSDDKVQIELPKPPAGEGEVYVAFCKDLRPSLDWSLEEGWTLPIVNGRTSCNAQLIFPSSQGVEIEREEVGSSQNASSTSRVSVISLAAQTEKSPESEQVKMDVDEVEKASSSDGISTMQVEESKSDDFTCEDVNSNNIDLNIMHEETLEASILDIEELANRINWLRSILDNNQSKSGSWKFAEQHVSTPSFYPLAELLFDVCILKIICVYTKII